MAKKTPRVVLLAAIAGIALTACIPEVGTTPNPQGGASSDNSPQAANSAPTINGSPAPSIGAGTTYVFQATATDPDGNQLTFSARGLPAWMTFNPQSGTFSGTPSEADVGTSADIVVTVSDGRTQASLAPFQVTVVSASAPSSPTNNAFTGTAALAWQAPAQNTDGSPAVNLGGYHVYHGVTANALNEVFDVPGASSNSYTVAQLGPGTHYFAVAAYTTSGMEGAMSAIGSKAIP